MCESIPGPGFASIFSTDSPTRQPVKDVGFLLGHRFPPAHRIAHLTQSLSIVENGQFSMDWKECLVYSACAVLENGGFLDIYGLSGGAMVALVRGFLECRLKINHLETGSEIHDPLE